MVAFYQWIGLDGVPELTALEGFAADNMNKASFMYPMG